MADGHLQVVDELGGVPVLGVLVTILEGLDKLDQRLDLQGIGTYVKDVMYWTMLFLYKPSGQQS